MDFLPTLAALRTIAPGHPLSYSGLAAAAGRASIRVTLASPPDAGAERLVSVHATARGAVPVLRLLPPEGPGAAHAPVLERHPGVREAAVVGAPASEQAAASPRAATARGVRLRFIGYSSVKG